MKQEARLSSPQKSATKGRSPSGAGMKDGKRQLPLRRTCGLGERLA